MASVFGKKRDVFSKSWSDLWDDEDDDAQFIAELENSYPPFAVEEEPKAVISEAGSGVSTPRGGLSEMKNPATVNNSRSRSPKNRRAADHVSASTGFVFEEHHSPPAVRFSSPHKRTVADKWAALGDRRRSPAVQAPVQTPTKPIRAPKPQPSPTSARKRSRTGTGKRSIHWGPSQHENRHNENRHSENHHHHHSTTHSSWEQNNWYKSKDWRQHTSHALVSDDLGDFEWVW